MVDMVPGNVRKTNFAAVIRLLEVLFQLDRSSLELDLGKLGEVGITSLKLI